MTHKKHPRYTYHQDSEGCDSIWLITDNATGSTVAGVRFWDAAQQTESEVLAIVNWLNRHTEEWMVPRKRPRGVRV